MDVSVIPVGASIAWTRDQILEALTHFVIKGSYQAVQNITGIPKQTLHDWAQKEWWHNALQAVQSEMDQEIDALTVGIIRKAAHESMDRLENGEVVPMKVKQTRKTENGTETTESIEMVHKPVSGVDATKIGTFWFNTQRILRNLPTSISSSSGESKLEAMAQRLKAIEQQQKATVVSEQ